MMDTREYKWIDCIANPGQFHDEFAVCGKDFSGEVFSLFVNQQFVHIVQGQAGEGTKALLKVVQLDRNEDYVLIQLPGRTFGNGSTITVKDVDLVSCMECEPA